MKRTALAIFDMDGTIVDSMRQLTSLAVIVCQNLFPRVHPDWIRSHYAATAGKPFATQLDLMALKIGGVSNAAVAEAVAYYRDLHKLMAPMFPLTLLGENLVNCRSHVRPNLKFALVSSTHKQIVLTMKQIWPCDFDFICGYEGPGTEKSAQIKRTMSELGVNAHDTCYIGDTPSDLELADQLGLLYWDANKHGVFYRVVHS